MLHEEDLAIARALTGGDETRFTLFFDEYFPRLYRFAQNRMDADDTAVPDIVQSTLMNAMRSIASYRGEAALFTWLCQICRNEIAGYYRKAARSVPVVAADDEAIRPILETLAAGDEMDPGSQYESLQTKRLIQEVLDFLPRHYGDVLEWKYIYGFSVTEIASKLGTTELGAQSLLSRSRTAFRKALTEISPQLASAMGTRKRGGAT